ncbi:MerR family transcriptional regulator [Microbacterium sp. PMB16]|uniref:MerR family transcriptional regulator n=1 Tax=Microbacterium sp. PMB16 TaxID=3120157 RepID=UPI003F4B8D5F
MTWSTSEVANLAGTTVNTVRHYHRTGLLDEPERLSNGYKQYRARHLVRLLQIRRLRELGVPLAQIEAVGFESGANSSQALLAIDADLAASIERLQRARAEIRAILEGASGTDVPAGFEDVAGKLSAPNRSLMLVYSQLYDESAMSDVKKMVQDEPDDLNGEFDELPADADEATRERLAVSMAPQLAQHIADYPWLMQPAAHLSKGMRVTQETFIATVRELYNEAQLHVLARASILATEAATTDAAPDRAPTDTPAAPNDEGESHVR